jgi:hypothetical protein
MDAKQFFHKVILSFHTSNLALFVPRSKDLVVWVSITAGLARPAVFRPVGAAG